MRREVVSLLSTIIRSEAVPGWGRISAAPAASQDHLGGEKHFDPGLRV